jgi:hypothetical protein
VSGFLRVNVTKDGLVGQFVTVLLSTDGGKSFTPVANLVTVTDGAFEVDQTQTVAGTYLYAATFEGTTDLAASVSNGLNVTVGAAPGPEPTALTISASPSNPASGDTFTVSGFLTDGVTGEGLVGQFVTVEVSANGGASFTPAANLVTVTDGAFDVDQTQTVAGTYLYRVTFTGTTDLASSVSGNTVVTVGAAPGPEPTALTFAASPLNPAPGDPFAVTGFLTDGVTGEGLVGQFVTIEISTNGGTSFSAVSDVLTFTDGAFVLGQTQTVAGTYLYRATFTGTTELAPSVSNRATVNVGAVTGLQSVSQAASQITVGESNPSSNDGFMITDLDPVSVNAEGMAGHFVTGWDRFTQ